MPGEGLSEHPHHGGPRVPRGPLDGIPDEHEGA